MYIGKNNGSPIYINPTKKPLSVKINGFTEQLKKYSCIGY
jgi:hypothetical protein